MNVTRLLVFSRNQKVWTPLLESKCGLLANPSVGACSIRQLCDTDSRTAVRALPGVVHSFRPIIHPRAYKRKRAWCEFTMFSTEHPTQPACSNLPNNMRRTDTRGIPCVTRLTDIESHTDLSPRSQVAALCYHYPVLSIFSRDAFVVHCP
jgi:hypothetical protein